MSKLAEFARILHESEPATDDRIMNPVTCPSAATACHDVRAVICDVYGTLVNYWRSEFAEPGQKEAFLQQAFFYTADYFGMIPSLQKVNPADSPEKTLSDFYHGLITLRHEQASKRGVSFPEIVIEEIWELIITILKRHGYDPALKDGESGRDFSRKVAWYYNFKALGRRLYPEVVTALEGLKTNNIVVGILSNAQFYTPIDLTLLIRDQSEGRYDDIFELFHVDLTFFSYEYQVAKPHRLFFRKLFDALYELQILPEQTVFVGNDLSIDIAPAKEMGMKTALFTGDTKSAFFHDCAGTTVPDLTFDNWADLPRMVSFHKERDS